MPIPINEDTRANAKNFVHFEVVDHIDYTNGGAALKAGDARIAGPYFGIADQDIANAADGTLDITDGEIVDTEQVAAGSTFAVPHAEVWFNPVTKKYQDTSANNLYGVGTVIKIMDAGGSFRFIKRRFWVREEFYADT
jgi:predicted RecA/RadA family phage recombinase